MYVQFLQSKAGQQTAPSWFEHAGIHLIASVMWGQRPACDQFARAQPDLAAIETTGIDQYCVPPPQKCPAKSHKRKHAAAASPDTPAPHGGSAAAARQDLVQVLGILHQIQGTQDQMKGTQAQHSRQLELVAEQQRLFVNREASTPQRLEEHQRLEELEHQRLEELDQEMAGASTPPAATTARSAARTAARKKSKPAGCTKETAGPMRASTATASASTGAGGPVASALVANSAWCSCVF